MDPPCLKVWQSWWGAWGLRFDALRFKGVGSRDRYPTSPSLPLASKRRSCTNRPSSFGFQETDLEHMEGFGGCGLRDTEGFLSRALQEFYKGKETLTLSPKP